VDHLNGVLFIDRMDEQTRSDLNKEIKAIKAATRKRIEAAKLQKKD
jgi:hypothetical protein